MSGRPSSARGLSTGSKPGARAPINKKKWFFSPLKLP
jgi:hypothetical protein